MGGKNAPAAQHKTIIKKFKNGNGRTSANVGAQKLRSWGSGFFFRDFWIGPDPKNDALDPKLRSLDIKVKNQDTHPGVHTQPGDTPPSCQ